MTFKSIIAVTLATAIVVVFCIAYIDYPVALWVEQHIRGYRPFHLLTSNLPSKLLLVDLTLTGLSWVGYGYLKARGCRNKHRDFFLVMGLVLPVAYVIKQWLKDCFGRIETRLWLHNPETHMQTWFNPRSWGFDGFPSGHMLVFTTLFLGLWYFYPAFRKWYATGLAALAIALLATNYHFVSDVIAGTYMGAVVFMLVYWAVSRNQPSQQQ